MIKLLLIKYVIFVVVIWGVLNQLTFITTAESLVIATVAALASYLMSDLAVLPTWGNAAASVVDFFTVWVVVWGSQLIWQVLNISVWEAILCAGVITAAEWFLHPSLLLTGARRLRVSEHERAAADRT